jgi:hypothetical protein
MFCNSSWIRTGSCSASPIASAVDLAGSIGAEQTNSSGQSASCSIDAASWSRPSSLSGRSRLPWIRFWTSKSVQPGRTTAMMGIVAQAS